MPLENHGSGLFHQGFRLAEITFGLVSTWRPDLLGESVACHD